MSKRELLKISRGAVIAAVILGIVLTVLTTIMSARISYQNVSPMMSLCYGASEPTVPAEEVKRGGIPINIVLSKDNVMLWNCMESVPQSNLTAEEKREILLMPVNITNLAFWTLLSASIFILAHNIRLSRSRNDSANSRN